MRFRPFFENDLPRAAFMGRVHIGEQVDHGDGADFFRLEGTSRCAHVVFIQRCQFVAFEIYPAAGFEGLALRCERGRALKEIIERVAVARLLLDFLDRAVSPGDHHPDLCAAHFQQGVGRDRGAVGEEFNRVGLFALGDEAIHTFEHTERRVGRRR